VKFFKWQKNNSEKHKFKSNKSKQKPVVDVTLRADRQLYKGSKQLYSERIEQNLQSLFQRLSDPNLVTGEFIVGSRSKTKVIMAYLQDVANPGIATLLPSFYIALTSFNLELIPSVLTITLTAAWEGTLFPIYFRGLVNE